MPQLKASAFSEPVRQALLRRCAEESASFSGKVEGLLEQLSLFHVEGLSTSRPMAGIFAIAYNILSRGAPTMASPRTEELLAKTFKYTTHDDSKEGIIRYDWQEGTVPDVFVNGVVNALHVILPQSKASKLRISKAGLESNFERAFIGEYIREEQAYLRQLFARQRPRATLGAAAGNEGRVDFCLEIPYLKWRTVNRYGKDHFIRYKEQHVVEVDGERYHKKAIDELKDFAIAGEGRAIHHIREFNASNDAQAFLRSVSANDYVQKLAALYKEEKPLTHAHYCHAFLPTAIARMQLALLEWLHTIPSETPSLKIAVIEQDIPAAKQAWKELKELLYTLDELAEQPTHIPAIELIVFTNDWLGKLILQPEAKAISEFTDEGYDAVFDLALLQRLDVFESPVAAENLILIRSAHYKEPGLQDSIKDALPVLFKYIGVAQNDGSFLPQEAAVVHLRKLLSLLFRKTDFREGQLPILARALRRKSVIGLLPTGGGKSLTYQFAAMLQPGITLVVDPIRSLMLDQHRGLNDIGITRSLFINSVLSTAEKREAQKELAAGRAQLVFISPERLVIQEFRDCLAQTQEAGFHFAHCVIDEVHCLSEWGHDFRTPYLHLGINAREFCKTCDGKELPLFGLTATASFDVLADIERELEIDKEDGHAVVRHENTVRNEIFFSIQEVTVPVDVDMIYNRQELQGKIALEKRSLLESAVHKKKSSLQKYQEEATLRERVLPNAYENYLPDFEREKGLDAYVTKAIGRLLKDADVPLQQQLDGRYNYGSIAFAPHRRGDYGVHNLFLAVAGNGETKGYFMGAGDDREGERIVNHQDESIKHMDAFITGKASLMFATKAFGMGIDKPDVRWTYHLNIPGSIESFVQEAGRAARDGKVALATVYFNRQRFTRLGDADAYKLDTDGAFLPDREILDFFYRLSFQGAIKETVILDELLTRILPPRISRLQLLANQFAAVHGLKEIDANPRTSNAERKVYVKIDGEEVGYLNITPNGIVPMYTPAGYESVVGHFRDHLRDSVKAANDVAFWLALGAVVESDVPYGGIETLLSVKKEVRLTIPFQNKYYPTTNRVTKEKIISSELRQKLKDCALFKKLIEEGIYANDAIDFRVEHSLRTSHSFHEFVNGFVNDSSPGLQEKIFTNKEVQQVYSLPRNGQDTAKAIYRLTTLGIVDSYTIDYQNNCFEILCRRKKEGFYLNELERVISRYSSAKDAAQIVSGYRQKYKSSEQSEMRYCLERLTEFVYAKIAEKRQLAMNDVVRLCEYALQIKEPIEQSEAIKSEVYYYFNAKYARPENEAVLENGKKTPACLLKRRDDEAEVVADEFIDLLDTDITGSFKNNLKHLRGAAQRSINAYPNFAAAYFLRAYCLIVQSEETNTQLLVENAIEDLKRGVRLLQNQVSTEQLTSFLSSLQQKIEAKVREVDVAEIFQSLDDEVLLEYHYDWLKQFHTHFLKKT